jgi:hypothetical protein
MSPRRSAFMRRMTPASDERRISGSATPAAARNPARRRAGCRRRRRPGRSARALVGRRLRDLLDLQLLDLVAVRIALDARQPGIDDVADARHGQRGFGDVGRQHDAPPDMRLEDALCSSADRRANSGRISVCGGWCLRSASAASRISRSPGRKTSTSPGPLAMQLVAGVDDRVVEVALVVGSLALVLLASAPGGNALRPGCSRPETSITGAPSKCCESARRRSSPK